MNKAFLFVIMLVSVSFVGCIEDSTDDTLTEDNTVDESSNEDTTQEDETITPVGTNGTVNMAPYVDAGIWEDLNYGNEEETSFSVFVNWAAKDFDGTIDSAGFDLDLDMVIDVPVETDYGVLLNESNYSNNHTLILGNNNWDYDIYNESQCGFIFHTTFAFIAVDNAGAYGIELVQYVLPNVIVYNDMVDILDEQPGLLGITQDHLDELDNAGCGYVAPIPIATFFVSQDSANVYHVEVIMVSVQAPLEDFSFFLKDGSGSTYVGGNGFGEVAMQFQGGEEMGIDMTYNADDEALKSRATNVSDDNGSQFPVHFSDNDRDGKLSSGDQFLVYGPDAGPAEDGWKLDIQFDATGDIIGSAKLL